MLWKPKPQRIPIASMSASQETQPSPPLDRTAEPLPSADTTPSTAANPSSENANKLKRKRSAEQAPTQSNDLVLQKPEDMGKQMIDFQTSVREQITALREDFEEGQKAIGNLIRAT